MKAELNWSEIAILVGVHQSTISRERRRNCGLQSYWPKQAYQRALHYATQRPSCVFVKRIGVGSIYCAKISGWNPEQIISHEWIYQHVREDKRRGGDLHCHLRCQKLRKKRYGIDDRRGQLRDCFAVR